MKYYELRRRFRSWLILLFRIGCHESLTGQKANRRMMGHAEGIFAAIDAPPSDALFPSRRRCAYYDSRLYFHATHSQYRFGAPTATGLMSILFAGAANIDVSCGAQHL